jgi:ABC-type multidrug transport system fused ATPase/permease subunit
VTTAARQAQALEFILALPEGFATRLGERGLRLSGGQKQRIALARALIRDPEILLLDEATNALDLESERLVQDAIDAVTRAKTVLVIAHRISTVESADQIIVLEGGRVVEAGSPAELAAAGGTFARLRALQYSSRQEESRSALQG